MHTRTHFPMPHAHLLVHVQDYTFHNDMHANLGVLYNRPKVDFSQTSVR